MSETGILIASRCCASRVAETPKEAWFSVAKVGRGRARVWQDMAGQGWGTLGTGLGQASLGLADSRAL